MLTEIERNVRNGLLVKANAKLSKLRPAYQDSLWSRSQTAYDVCVRRAIARALYSRGLSIETIALVTKRARHTVENLLSKPISYYAFDMDLYKLYADVYITVNELMGPNDAK